MMGNQRVSRIHLVFLCMFFIATEYTCVGAQNSTRSCHERERQALLEFKHSVEDKYGMLSSWVGTDCCSWKGVRCDGSTGSVISLHLKGNYMEIIMSYMSVEEHHYLVVEKLDAYYLVGDKVKAYLAELRHLKHLDLSGNYFQGSQIPEFIGSLKQLSYLNLSYAGFSGIIPYHIGNLSNLKVLDLGSNYYSPQELIANDVAWVSSLSSLDHLDLSYVNLFRAKNIDMVFHIIPSLTYLSLSGCGLSNVDLGLHLNSSKILPKIQHLDLGFNHFEGQLPHFLQNMTSLTFLDLSRYDPSPAWNSLKLLNTLPTLLELHLYDCGLDNTHFSPTYLNFSALPNIQYLDLIYNSIGGQFPSALMNITSLRVLLLSFNRLNSSIPVMPNLLKLDVYYNNFESIEAVGIWRQCHLKELSLSIDYSGKEMISPSSNTSECSQYALERLNSEFNDFNSPILGSLGRLTNLRELWLWGNNFQLEKISLTGSIPESLGRLINLRVLQLQRISLTGSIPTALERIRSLEVLDLSYNHLNGSIPDLFGRLTGLTHLYLQSNQLTGQIPVSIGQLSKLIYLDLSENSLEGVVFEAHFANLSMLKKLQTPDNYNLVFNISQEWTPPFQLRFIDLSSCKMANGFPKWLQTQRKLETLILSNASLHGLLPTFFRKMPKLYFLDLSYNKFSGSLMSLPLSEHTSILLLQDNLFSGPLPRSLCKSTHLRFLDVSSNQLSGSIPKCVENLHDLEFLILSSNRLSGALPSSLGNMSSSLDWLKLSDNNFNGKLPPSLGNLRNLKVLDLGNNEFSGSIPKWIGKNFTNLVVFILHKNNFTGGIPQSLCRCSHLQILDIAHNNLNGSIPRCFGELRGMIEETYPSLYNGSSSYDAGVIQVIKGVQLGYTKNLDLLINMDLSSNKLTGVIPREVTALVLLMGLNLSHNHLSGSIPVNIGNMKALNSLDLSNNLLKGTIPPSMAALNFLSVMNLSYNNLSGRIPTGNQLRTLTDPSIYAGNEDLCGDPLPNDCSSHENPPTTISKKIHEDANEPEKVWFYMDITCGFATGFWGVIGVLSFKKQWWRKLFMVVEVTLDKVFVMIAVRVSKIKRDREGI